jgi:hypothetical protein
MEMRKLILTLLLLPYFLFPGKAFSQAGTQVPAPKRELLYQRVVSMVEKKMDPILQKLPQGNLIMVEQEKKSAVKEELTKRIAGLENATNAQVASYKKELIKLNESELSNLRSELHGYLNAMSERELNDLGNFILKAPEYKDIALEYESAFTQKEKVIIIKNALSEDLGFLRTIYNKKIGLSTLKGLKHDLENNLLFFNQGTNKDNKKLLLICGAVLAGVALVSWGIASSTYGGRYKRAESAREQELNSLKADLQAKYLAYQDDLTTKEQNFLRDNGFVRTVCGTYSQPDSKLCNGYGYKLFSGTKYCTVYCQKSTITGNETMHEPPVCTSAFIPADCYDPNEYWNAYQQGDTDGYNDGYDDGSYRGDSDGHTDGVNDGRNDGDSDGRDDGYDSGYDDGYDDGYSQGATDGWIDSGSPKSLSFVPFAKSPSYLKGFKDGFEQYQLLFLSL